MQTREIDMALNWNADRKLVKRILAGDKAAGEQLCLAHYPGVLRFLLYLTGHPNEAEELAQDTFVRAWQRLNTFEGRSTFKTWLHQVAYREFAARRKLPDAHELDDDLPDDRPSFVSDIVEALAIERAIATLPEQLRVTFLICHVQEMSVKEASEILEVPVGTVLSRLSTARARLRRQLTIRDVVIFAGTCEDTLREAPEGPHKYEMSKAAL